MSVRVEVPAPLSQTRLALRRLDEPPLPPVDRVLVALAGRFACETEGLSHTTTRLVVHGGRYRGPALRAVAERTSRRAVHYTRFGVRTGASTTPVPAARRRR